MTSRTLDNTSKYACKNIYRYEGLKQRDEIFRSPSSTPKQFFGSQLVNSNFDDYTFVRNPAMTKTTKTTKQTETKNAILILVISDSNVKSKAYRNVLRETIGHVHIVKSWRLSTVFLVGTNSTDQTKTIKVEKESAEFNDIILGDFPDDYLSFTTKTAMAYRWSLEHFHQIKYILRITHDVIVNPYKLVELVDSIKRKDPEKDSIIAGVVAVGAKPSFTHPRWAYKSTVPWPPHVPYPPYPLGAAVLTSIRATVVLNTAMCSTPIIFPDDAYIGILAEKADIHPIGLEHFLWSLCERFLKLNEEIRSGKVAVHCGGSPNIMTKIWRYFQQTKTSH